MPSNTTYKIPPETLKDLEAGDFESIQNEIIDSKTQYNTLKVFGVRGVTLELAENLAIALRYLPTITHVNFAWCEMNENTEAVFAKGLTDTNVTTVNINFSGLSAENACALVKALPPQVDTIDLQFNYVGKNTCAGADLPTLLSSLKPTVKHLNLALNDISNEEALSMMERSIPDCKLHTLNLKDNDVDEDVLNRINQIIENKKSTEVEDVILSLKESISSKKFKKN